MFDTVSRSSPQEPTEVVMAKTGPLVNLFYWGISRFPRRACDSVECPISPLFFDTSKLRTFLEIRAEEENTAVVVLGCDEGCCEINSTGYQWNFITLQIGSKYYCVACVDNAVVDIRKLLRAFLEDWIYRCQGCFSSHGYGTSTGRFRSCGPNSYAA